MIRTGSRRDMVFLSSDCIEGTLRARVRRSTSKHIHSFHTGLPRPDPARQHLHLFQASHSYALLPRPPIKVLGQFDHKILVGGSSGVNMDAAGSSSNGGSR